MCCKSPLYRKTDQKLKFFKIFIFLFISILFILDPYIFDQDINGSNNMIELRCLSKTFTNSYSVFDKKMKKKCV